MNSDTPGSGSALLQFGLALVDGARDVAIAQARPENAVDVTPAPSIQGPQAPLQQPEPVWKNPMVVGGVVVAAAAAYLLIKGGK